MLHFSRTKIWAIIVVLVLGVIIVSPNVLPASASNWMRANLGLRPITLGLDLQGGSEVLLEIDQQDLRKNLLKKVSSDIRVALREARIGYRITPGPNSVAVKILEPDKVVQAAPLLEALREPVADNGLGGPGSQVFDLKNEGDLYTFSFSQAGIDARIGASIRQSLTIVERRVNAMGTTESTVQQQGQNRIVVQLPGIQDSAAVKAVIGRTAKLTFQLVCATQPEGPTDLPPADCEAVPQKERPGVPLWVKTSSLDTIDGADLVGASGGFSQDNQPVVNFQLNQRGGLAFARLTRENVNKRFAIILDGVVQSAPSINEPITQASGQISGSFTPQETHDMSVVLRSGALPAKLDIVQETVVGPSLGADSIRAGMIASGIGLVAVVIFMLLVYGIFGVFADLALFANLIILVALMSLFGFTLTLPGIAGIVLTMGMAVDSNVLIYERIREEWRNGRSALNSIQTGFKFALATVVDANVTTLLAAVVLFLMGSGPIRGFAITLALGVVTTVFTAFTLTALIVSIWVKYTKPKTVPL